MQLHSAPHGPPHAVDIIVKWEGLVRTVRIQDPGTMAQLMSVLEGKTATPSPSAPAPTPA